MSIRVRVCQGSKSTSRYSAGEIDREVINREAAGMVDLPKESE